MRCKEGSQCLEGKGDMHKCISLNKKILIAPTYRKIGFWTLLYPVQSPAALNVKCFGPILWEGSVTMLDTIVLYVPCA